MNIIQSYVRNDVQQLNLFVVECKQLPKNKIKDIKIGLAGEYLVMSKLIKMGYSCALSGNGEPYDILVDIPKAGIQKIQIKTKSKNSKILNYNFRRGYHGSKTGTYAYSDDDFDISAVVLLQESKVLFKYGVHDSISIRIEDFIREGAEEASLRKSIKEAIKESGNR